MRRYVKVKANSKQPVEKDWEHKPYTKEEIDQWVALGNNRGLLYSKATKLCCIDIDYLDKFPFKHLIDNPDTLAVKTKKGVHLIYVRPEGLANKNGLDGWGELLYDNKQGLIPPSVVDGVQRKWFGTIKKPMEMGKELLNYLKSKIINNYIPEDTFNDNSIKLTIPKGSRNNTLIHIAGILRKDIPNKYINKVISIFNGYLEEPLSAQEVRAIARQAGKYNNIDTHNLTEFVYEVLVDQMTLRELQRVIEKEGIKTSYHYLQITVDRLVKAGRVFKVSRGVYRSTKPVKTTSISKIQAKGEPIKYTLPFKITEVADIYPNSIIMIASQAGHGKTHIFAHIVRHLLEQKIPISYWDMENDINNIVHIFKQFIPAQLIEDDMLRINEEDVSIESLLLDKDRVNFVDPIYVEDGWGEVDNIMRRLKMQLDGGLCFIATHVKDIDGRVFGGATAMKVPSFAAEFKHKGDRFHSEFKILKIRNWKPDCKINTIKTVWDDRNGLMLDENYFGNRDVGVV